MKDKKSLTANFGLTLKEAKALLFLSIFFIISIVAYFLFNNKSEQKAFDYKKQDSVFNAKSIHKEKRTSTRTSKAKVLKQKPVNLLKANLEELSNIEGISKIKAEKIISLRKEGKLNFCIDIVKAGIISRSHFDNIKTYIYIK